MISICMQMLLGFGLGYLATTIVESFLHKHINHPKKHTRQLWRKMGFLGQSFLNAHYSHQVIHHGKTFKKNFVTQFESHEERHELVSQLEGSLGALIVRERFGLTLRGRGIILFSLPIVPFAPAIYLLFGQWVFIGSIPSLMLFSLMTIFIHTYIHMPYQEALSKSPFFISLLLRTRYMRAVIRNHYMHHRYPNTNFNLALGGDYILGYHRSPSANDLQEMEKLGLPVD